MKLSNAEISSLLFDEQGSDPATPASGFWRLYLKSAGLFLVDDAGAVTGPFGSSADLAAHLADTGDAHDASAISYAGGTGMAATDVEAAIDELATEKANLAGGTFTADISVPDEAYDATAWNGSLEVPTKNALRDKIETLGGGSVSDAVYGAGWDGDTTTAPSKNAVYDKIETLGGGGSIVMVKAARTAGDLSLTSTSIASVDTGIDLVIAAVAGDILKVELDATIDNQGEYVNMDAYTIVSGSPVNPLGPGVSASLASVTGVQAWRCSNAAVQQRLTGGPPPYVVQAGDISGGQVTIRLRYAKLTSNSRTLFANANAPLSWWVLNLG